MMDEYELAELALMEKAYVIQLEELAQGYISIIQTEANILLGMIFGYLLTAHFIGTKLSKAQVIILNGLYMFTVLSSLAVYQGHFSSLMFTVERVIAEKGRDASDIPITGTPGGELTVVIAYILMIIASLYFMWTVRHPDNEGKFDAANIHID